jgi:hypothetical protein
MLIVTGGTTDDAAGATGSPSGRARWRERADVAPSWRVRLLQALDAPTELAAHCALTVSLARGRPDEAAWLATPVHLFAGIDRAFLAPNGVLRLDDDEWQAMCSGFARQFGRDGLWLERVASDVALLRGAALGELQTYEPAECVGEDLRQRLPRGPGVARWRALTGELELWLHAEPWNRERERRGRLPVTGLWLWGGRVAAAGGAPWPRPVRPRRTARWWLIGDDPWLASLPALHGDCALCAAEDFETVLASGADTAGVAVLWRGQSGIDELERRWLAPARHVQTRGALATVSLHHGARCWQLDRTARWRWWQPARTVAELAAVKHV